MHKNSCSNGYLTFVLIKKVIISKSLNFEIQFHPWLFFDSQSSNFENQIDTS
jgi:hypothetical protein